jgi:hypothetical protein
MGGVQAKMTVSGYATMPDEDAEAAFPDLAARISNETFWRIALAKDGPDEILGALILAGWRRNRTSGGWRHPAYLPEGAIPWWTAAMFCIKATARTDDEGMEP